MATSVSVVSEPQPQSGQKHRSSDNFSTDNLDDWGGLKWSCPDGISFDVKKDKSGLPDSTEFSNVSNGTITKFSGDRNLYIANPEGASQEFTVTAESYKK